MPPALPRTRSARQSKSREAGAAMPTADAQCGDDRAGHLLDCRGTRGPCCARCATTGHGGAGDSCRRPDLDRTLTAPPLRRRRVGALDARGDAACPPPPTGQRHTYLVQPGLLGPEEPRLRRQAIGEPLRATLTHRLESPREGVTRVVALLPTETTRLKPDSQKKARMPRCA
jgi:hypothetical protein